MTKKPTERALSKSSGERVRQRILDSAERLFAARGFYGASVRDVTDAAEVRLAAVNYHFGTKEELFRRVLLRRLEILTIERLDLLGSVPGRGSARVRTRAWVWAFVEPVRVHASAGDDGWRHYLALVAQVASSRLSALERVADEFNRLALEFVSQLSRIYPGASRPALHHAYQFMLSTTLYAFSDNARLDSLTGGRLRSDAHDKMADAVVRFVVPGVMALCRGEKPAKG